MCDDKAKQFDYFFSKNYKLLLNYSKSIDRKSEDSQDLLHNVFLKCRNRIISSGYSGNDFLNFTRVSILNTYKTDYKNNKKITKVNIDDPNFYNYIDQYLGDKEIEVIKEKEIQDREVFLTAMIYEYLEKYVDERDRFIFKSYFLLKHRHINYQQLSECTGFSLSTVSNTIKRLKKQLKKDLKCYILGGLTMNELLEEVRILLTKPIGPAYEEYSQMYTKITGSSWTICKCKKDKLLIWMKNWYNENKNK